MLLNTLSFDVSIVSAASFMNSWQNMPRGELLESTQVAFSEVTFTKTHSKNFRKCLRLPVSFGLLNHLVAHVKGAFAVERKLGAGALPPVRHLCQGHICVQRGYIGPCAHTEHSGCPHVFALVIWVLDPSLAPQAEVSEAEQRYPLALRW